MIEVKCFYGVCCGGGTGKGNICPGEEAVSDEGLGGVAGTVVGVSGREGKSYRSGFWRFTLFSVGSVG